MRLTVRETRSSDEENFNEIQRAYNACMAIDVAKEAGIKPMQNLLGDLSKILASSKGSADKKITEADSRAISDATLFLERMNVASVISFYPGADDKNPVSIPVIVFELSRLHGENHQKIHK